MRILDTIGQRFKVPSRVRSDKAFAQKSSDQTKQAYISKMQKIYSLKLTKERGGGGDLNGCMKRQKFLFYFIIF